MSKPTGPTPADIERIVSGFVELATWMGRWARDFRTAMLVVVETASRLVEAETKAAARLIDTDLE